MWNFLLISVKKRSVTQSGAAYRLLSFTVFVHLFVFSAFPAKNDGAIVEECRSSRRLNFFAPRLWSPFIPSTEQYTSTQQTPAQKSAIQTSHFIKCCVWREKRMKLWVVIDLWLHLLEQKLDYRSGCTVAQECRYVINKQNNVHKKIIKLN